MKRWAVPAVGWLLCLVCAVACGDEEGGGAAGMGPVYPMALGDSCAGPGGTLPCPSGLTCGSALFPNQCTIQCAQSSACGLHATATGANAICFGAATGSGGGSCGIPCTTNEQCPAGTTCQLKGTGMACGL